MSEFNPDDYGPVFSSLLAIDRCRDLGPGKPDVAAAKQLRETDLIAAFAHEQVQHRELAQLCLGGVWLLHDYLDESHAISQRVETCEGSYWHGIIHRREGDFSNAKYWFRRVGDHPVYEELFTESQRLAEAAGGDVAAVEVRAWNTWDPDGFVDLCRAALRREPAQRTLPIGIQRREWELLFDDCYRRAVGR